MNELLNDINKPLNPDNNDDGEISGNNKKAIPLCGVCKLRYYQQYFDVNTYDVVKKLTYSLLFICNNFPDVAGNKTDLYGPFWIYATLVFSLAISQNIYSYASKPENAKFQYTVAYIPPAFAIIFSFGFVVPLIFNFMLSVLGCMMTYTRAIEIYGYSQIINIIMILLCSWPNSSLQTGFI